MEALVNHLWQSTAFAAVIALICFVLRSNHPRVRYWLWMAASLKFLVPFSLLFVVGRQAATRIEQPAMLKTVPVEVVEQVALTFTPMGSSVEVAVQRDWTGVLLAVWLIGVLVVAARWFRAWLRIRNAVRFAEPVDIAAPIPVLSTTATIEPGIFGLFRPVLLLPRDITIKLSADELRAVLAHELCHFRYRDNLTAALHMIVSAIFWFHPLVWWIGHRLVEERERACDEHVLSQGNSREAYAQSILTVCKHYVASPVPCASGVSGADLRKRIQAIMLHRISRRLTVAHIALLSAAGLAVLAGPVCIGVLKGAIGDAPKFEVATVRPTAIDDIQFRQHLKDGTLRVGTRIQADRAEFTFVTLHELIVQAYGMGPSQVVSPDWMHKGRFDVICRLPKGASKDDVPFMLQSLLAERFGLTVRREMREQDVAALVVGKDGPKLKASSPEPDVNAADARSQPKGSNNRLNFMLGPTGYRFTFDNDNSVIHWEGIGATMAELAHMLTRTGSGNGRPVVDLTGLKGNFDVVIDIPFSAVGAVGSGGPSNSAASAQASTRPAELAPSPGLETVGQSLKKLGLALEKRRVSVEHLIVEHAERKPTEN